MKRSIIAALFVSLVSALPAQAEDLDAIFSKVKELVAAKNYPKAIEELGWANKEIEKMNSQHLVTFFPDEVAGYTGGETEHNSALGFTTMERSYTKSGTSPIKLSLTGGSNASAAGGLGGLAAFGKMAAMMGNQPGMDTFRIAGRTATMQSEGRDAELSIFLDSGGILKLEGQGGKSAADLRAFAEALKVNELDTYLRGQS